MSAKLSLEPTKYPFEPFSFKAFFIEKKQIHQVRK
jgi:hypothetical protein